MQQQSAVLPDPVVAEEAPAVALVHMDVVDPVAGQEPEHLVLDVRFGAEAGAEEVQACVRVVHRAPHVVVEEVGEVVVGARDVRRQRAQAGRVEEVAAHEVEVRASGTGQQRVPAVGQLLQTTGHRVPEVVGDQVEQVGRCLLGEHIDRGAVVRSAVVGEVDLIVRSFPLTLAPGTDGTGDQDTVGLQWHVDQLPLRAGGLPGPWQEA